MTPDVGPLLEMSNTMLIEEVLKERQRADMLYAAILEHAGEKGHGRCQLDDDRLYAKAGIKTAETRLPPRCEFIPQCHKFWENRQHPEVKQYLQECKIVVEESPHMDFIPGGIYMVRHDHPHHPGRFGKFQFLGGPERDVVVLSRPDDDSNLFAVGLQDVK